MTISPVTPKSREQLVPTTTAIIFDATEAITTVTVNLIVVWSGGAAQNGWLGYTISHPGGTRYVLDPPGAFSVGTAVSVVVVGASTSLPYLFAVGLRQITFTDDASVPRYYRGRDRRPAVGRLQSRARRCALTATSRRRCVRHSSLRLDPSTGVNHA